MAASEEPVSNGASRTCLWCVPRSASTALTMSLSSIADTHVWFEPYIKCKFYTMIMKEQLGIELPTEYEGNEEIYRRTMDHYIETDQGIVRDPEYLSLTSTCRFMERPTNSHVFVKDMSLTPEQYRFIPKGFKHLFLIRHPLRVFTSLRKTLHSELLAMGRLAGEAAVDETFDVERHSPFANLDGLQHKDVYEMWKYVQEDLGAESIVIDADDLLTKPAEMVSKICRVAGLPYDESLLQWDGSPEIMKRWEIGVDGLVDTLVCFHETAFSSSEFLPASDMPSRDDVTPDVIRLTDQNMMFYDEMYEVRLQV